MVQVRKTGQKFIDLQGHAENRVVCAMVTFACVNLVRAITEYLNEIDVKYLCRKGFFLIKIEGLSEKAKMFVDVFWKSLHDLMHDYSNSFAYIEDIPENDKRYRESLLELKRIVFDDLIRWYENNRDTIDLDELMQEQTMVE